MKRWLWILLLAVLLSLPVAAEQDAYAVYEEQWIDSGAAGLYDALSPETQALLERWGVTGADWEQLLRIDPAAAAESLWESLLAALAAPLRTLCVLIGVLMLSAWADALRGGSPADTVPEVFGTVCTLVLCGTLAAPLLACVRVTAAAMESIRVFMYSFVPVYVAVLAAGGKAASAASYRTVLLTAGELLTEAVDRLVLPLTSCCLALEAAGSTSLSAGGITRLIRRCVTWLLGGAATLFVGILTVQSGLGTAVDTVGTRVLRFSLAEIIPTVGGALGEALTAVSRCLGLLRGTVGIFGIVATVGIVVPPFLQCGAWVLCVGAASAVAELLGLSAAKKLLDGLAAALRMPLAGLACCALFMIASTAAVMGVG